MEAGAPQEYTLRTVDEWGPGGEGSSLPSETTPPQPPSPRVESASWFSGDPESERELVDASELRTVWKGGQESCNLEREGGAPVKIAPCEEVEAGMASTRPRGNYLVYAEPKEMEFSEGDAVEWVQNHSYGAESQPDGL